MKIYLDVCCLNRPFDDQTQQRIHLEAEAVLSILERAELLRWIILGGDAITFEISQDPDHDRRSKVENLAKVADTYIEIDRSIGARAEELEQRGFKAVASHPS